MKKKKPWLSIFVITLALVVAFSFVAISHLLIKSGKENPSASIDISVSDNNSNNDKTESNVSTPVQSETGEHKPDVDLIGGKGGVYHKENPII